MAPTLCMNAESPPATRETAAINRRSPVPANPTIARAMRMVTPVRSSPRPRIITESIAMTALLENPERARAGVTSPNHASARVTSTAATSTLMAPEIKRTAVPATTSRVRRISVSIGHPG
ncbi:MAG: hypothetical protein PWR21_1299 [Methanoculleus sp.]|nr:hypothetical protein [Methanoculleus sp.]